MLSEIGIVTKGLRFLICAQTVSSVFFINLQYASCVCESAEINGSWMMLLESNLAFLAGSETAITCCSLTGKTSLKINDLVKKSTKI